MDSHPARKTRVPSVDASRGFVMIVMALDHTRDFSIPPHFSFRPDNLTRTTPILFFTRWITKYPPWLDFLPMTLGPATLLPVRLERLEFLPSNPLIVFARVPRSPGTGLEVQSPPDYGYSLGGVYVLWAAVVLLIYLLCLRYSRLKARRTDWWLGYH